MALVETEALVLRTYNLSEADKIVVCLSRKAGLIRGVASGSRRLRNKFGAAFEPFTLINLTYYQKEQQELVSFRQAEILRSSFDVLAEPITLSGLAYMGDLIVEFSPPYQENETLFRMVKACIEDISETPEDLQLVLRYFEVWLMRLEGFLPDLKRCADCHRGFEAGESVMVGADQALRCRSCKTGEGRALSRQAHEQLLACLKLAPGMFARQARETSNKTKRELAQLTELMIGRVLERQLKPRPSYGLANLEVKGARC
jgi:DNA repair protein RecO (recombination protein O)